MIAGILGAALLAAAVCAGIAAAYGDLSPAADGVVAAAALLLSLGGGVIGVFAINRAAGRIPNIDEGAGEPTDAQIRQWITEWERRNDA